MLKCIRMMQGNDTVITSRPSFNTAERRSVSREWPGGGALHHLPARLHRLCHQWPEPSRPEGISSVSDRPLSVCRPPVRCRCPRLATSPTRKHFAFQQLATSFFSCWIEVFSDFRVNGTTSLFLPIISKLHLSNISSRCSCHWSSLRFPTLERAWTRPGPLAQPLWRGAGRITGYVLIIVTLHRICKLWHDSAVAFWHFVTFARRRVCPRCALMPLLTFFCGFWCGKIYEFRLLGRSLIFPSPAFLLSVHRRSFLDLCTFQINLEVEFLHYCVFSCFLFLKSVQNTALLVPEWSQSALFCHIFNTLLFVLHTIYFVCLHRSFPSRKTIDTQ